MWRTRLLSFVVFAALSGGSAQLAEAKPGDAQPSELLIGYVNVQRAILEVEEGKRAKDQLKASFDVKQKELSKREEELKALKDAIDKQSVVKDDAATKAQKTQFQAKLLELQQLFMKEQQALQDAQGKLVADIAVKLRKVVEEIGSQGGYTLILEGTESRLLFARPHLDLTNEVIRKYNARYR